jgi:hypothetical protein
VSPLACLLIPLEAHLRLAQVHTRHQNLALDRLALRDQTHSLRPSPASHTIF